LKPNFGSESKYNYGLPKHQKRILIACHCEGCFHPASDMYVIGCHNRWFCGCHNPIEKKPCKLDEIEKAHIGHPTSGKCTFCNQSNSSNIIHGLDGAIVYVCNRCIVTPIQVTRKFWRYPASCHPSTSTNQQEQAKTL
jgi:hypothetical protein